MKSSFIIASAIGALISTVLLVMEWLTDHSVVWFTGRRSLKEASRAKQAGRRWSARMISVTVEILPGGYADRRRTVGLMNIANISDLAPRSDYRVDIAEGDNPLAGTKARSWTVYVRDHHRNQSVWPLIAAAAAKGADFVQHPE
jgi:hypothetical protein